MTENKIDINNIEELAKAAAGFAYEKKARDIMGINLVGKSPMTDYFLICSGSNKPQIKAICDNIDDKMAEIGLNPGHIEGYQEAKWVLMDYGSIIIHIFDDESREYFNLERLWGDAPAVRFSSADNQ
ncbi:MAG: ribosome silencing factor [Bacillota bacterium]|jgi:ribosome-associated protein